MLGRLLQSPCGLVQKLVEQAVAEALDLRAILGREVGEVLQRPFQLGGPQRIEATAELFDHRHDRQGVVPGPECCDLLLHDVLRLGDFRAPLGRAVGGDGLEIVDIVQEDVFQLADGRVHVPRHGEVEDAQLPPAAPPDRAGYVRPGHDAVRRGGRAQHDVHRGELLPGFVQRQRGGAVPLGDRPCAVDGAVRDEGDLHAFGPQTGGGKFGRIPRPEDERRLAVQRAEDLAGQLDGRRGRRGGAVAQPRFAADARAHEQRRLEQAV